MRRIAGVLHTDGWRGAIRRSTRRLRDEIRAIGEGFLAHAYVGKLYMGVLALFAAMMTVICAAFLVAAFWLAEHPIFVAAMAGFWMMLTAAFWWMLYQFARFRPAARWQTLLMVVQVLGTSAYGWLFMGRPVWAGLAGLAWLALGVQLGVYLMTNEAWQAKEPAEG